MKFLLVAIYLAHGAASPEFQQRPYADKAECQADASAYVKRPTAGQAWAFCAPMKGLAR